MHPRYSTADAVAKAKALCSFSPSFGLARVGFGDRQRAACGGWKPAQPGIMATAFGLVLQVGFVCIQGRNVRKQPLVWERFEVSAENQGDPLSHLYCLRKCRR